LGVDTVWKWAVLLRFDRNPQSGNEQRGSMPLRNASNRAYSFSIPTPTNRIMVNTEALVQLKSAIH
jgi:hypothetical protein